MKKSLKLLPALIATIALSNIVTNDVAKASSELLGAKLLIENNKQSSINKTSQQENLLSYYSKGFLELKNVDGTLENGSLTFYPSNGPSISIKYTNQNWDNQKHDVFVVSEAGNNYNRSDDSTPSFGGVTPTNTKAYTDYVKAPDIQVKKQKNGFISEQPMSNFYIYKEKISLKELDFKLRQKLINEHNLYKSDGYSSGEIVIYTVDNKKYTFVLSQKLQTHRMSDIIDGTKIKNIQIDLK
ncbi:TPA: exotoxin beta-grasp domain-containing protein [Staphylococcus aureus]